MSTLILMPLLHPDSPLKLAVCLFWGRPTRPGSVWYLCMFVLQPHQPRTGVATRLAKNLANVVWAKLSILADVAHCCFVLHLKTSAAWHGSAVQRIALVLLWVNSILGMHRAGFFSSSSWVGPKFLSPWSDSQNWGPNESMHKIWSRAQTLIYWQHWIHTVCLL